MNTKDIINGDDQILEIFKNTAPGTYRHCLNVSLLCEAVGEIMNDINSENLVIAAKLHDIGKCNNPKYFSENQDQENVHDVLEASVSYQYISRHVADSVLTLVQMGCPVDIIKIISEHHGDSVIGSLHNKAPDVDENFFRYKSSKPTMKESCILMICDVIESAARAYFNAGKLDDEKILIDNLINRLIDDEQLDILTIGDIRTIKKILLKEVKSIYHKRVEYGNETAETVD